MRRITDYYSELNVVGKILVGVIVCVAVFIVVFLMSTAVVSLFYVNDDSASQGGSGSGSPPERTIEETTEDIPLAEVSIDRAEWVGPVVEIEGAYDGALSSVQCDLFEGEDFALLEWWDREVPTQLSEDGFTKLFTAAEGQQVPADAEDYQVYCSGVFAGSRALIQVEPVTGEPSSN